MKKSGKRIIAAGICAGLAMTSLTGCSSLNKNAVVATMDGEDIKLGEVLFSLRYSQAGTESYLGALFGVDNMWEQDLMGSGEAYGVSYKEQIMEAYKNMLILEKHMSEYEVELTAEEEAAISQAAKQFIEDNSSEVLKEMCADEETVSRVLTLYTIESKMRTAIEAGADRNVTDEEAAQKTIEYTLFGTEGTTDEEGNTVELTEEEKEAVKQQAQDTIDKVKAGEEFADALKEVNEDKTTLTNSYGAEGSSLSEALTTAADALEDGEIVDEPVETENGWYVVQMKTTFDEEKTEERKQEIIAEREDALYTETLEGWEPESFEINSKVWDKVTFEDKFTVKQTEGSEEADTEESTETASETGTEAESETETGTEAESETETGTEAESETETEAESETEPVSETESEAETVSETEK